MTFAPALSLNNRRGLASLVGQAARAFGPVVGQAARLAQKKCSEPALPKLRPNFALFLGMGVTSATQRLSSNPCACSEIGCTDPPEGASGAFHG